MIQRYRFKVWICAASIALSLALTSGANLVLGVEPAGAGSTLPDDTALGRFELFSPAFSGIGSNSLADVARRFPGGIFGAHNPTVIHAANPEAKAYRYQLGPFIQIRYVPKHLVPPSHPFYAEAGTASTLLPESALVKEGPGDPYPGMCLWMRRFPPYATVVPDSPGWLEHVDSVLPKLIVGYDGVFLDSIGAEAILTNYLLAKPINPRTAERYTVAEWFAAEGVMMDRVKRHMHPRQVLLLQGLTSGEMYFGEGSLRALLEKADGGMAESIFRGPSTPADGFPSPESWRRQVDLIADVAAKGKLGYYWTKAWVPLTDEQRSQWLRYTLSSFLLAAGPKSYLNFDSVNEPVPAGRGNNANAAEYYAEYDRARQLGITLDPAMSQVPGTGVFRRRWEHGLVLVNPAAQTAEVPTPGEWVNLDGQPVHGSLKLPGHGGQILLSTRDGSAPPRPAR